MAERGFTANISCPCPAKLRGAEFAAVELVEDGAEGRFVPAVMLGECEFIATLGFWAPVAAPALVFGRFPKECHCPVTGAELCGALAALGEFIPREVLGDPK